VSDHAGPEVERDDEGQRLLRATREDTLLVRDERETDVGRQPECARRDKVAEDRGQAMPDMGFMRASMHEPGSGGPEHITAKHFEDRHKGDRDALKGRIVNEEPGCEACESDEEEDADKPRTVRDGLPRCDRRRRCRMAPEVERDDDHDRVHEDGRHGGVLEDERIPIRRRDHHRDRPANAPMREPEGLGQFAHRRDGHVRAPSMVRLRLTPGSVDSEEGGNRLRQASEQATVVVGLAGFVVRVVRMIRVDPVREPAALAVPELGAHVPIQVRRAAPLHPRDDRGIRWDSHHCGDLRVHGSTPRTAHA